MYRVRAFAPICVALLMACGDESPAGPAGAEVDRVELTPEAAEIQLGDSAQLVARLLDEGGSVLSGRTITWTSSDPAVLDVSSSGMVRGRAAGTATVSAATGDAQATANITVLPWNIADDLLVVDSTTLRLVSDSAERAAGTLRFDVLQGAPATPAAGDVIVGAQAGGFLRRVVTASVSGGVMTLETTQAALSDVVEHGEFATTIDLLFDPAAPGPRTGLLPGANGDVVWGEGRFSNMATGVTVRAAGFDLSGVDICEMLKSTGGASCPDQLKKLTIKTGRLDFSPDLEMSAEFEGFALQSFRGVATGSLDLDLALVLEADGTLGELKHDVEFFTFTRPFFMQLGPVPVVGYVELMLTGAVTAKATAKASFEAGFNANSSVELGAEYENDSWTAVTDNTANFNPTVPSIGNSTLNGSMEIEAKVAMKPRLQIIFYGLVGPFAQVEPFGSATLTLAASTCGIKGASGIDAAVGFTVPFLDDEVMDFDQDWQPLITGPGSSWDCPLGQIDVNTTTSGQDTDSDGYTVLVDGAARGDVTSTGQLLLTLIPVGEHTITLEGIAPNCTVQGGAERTVQVLTGGSHPVDYIVDCTTLVGALEVTTSTSGANPDTDGYTIVLDGGSTGPIGANASVVIEGVAEGTHNVTLAGVASNCTVTPASAAVTVAAGATAQVNISVSCTASDLVVNTSTSGPPAQSDGWSVTLDGGDERSITPNGQVTYSTTAEIHTLELKGIPANCTVTGTNPATVTVAVNAPTTHTFAVACTAASLTVNVTTGGDFDEGSTYDVVVDDTITSTVQANGSVAFAALATGSHTVELRGMLDNCVVAGMNPRSVAAPGSVDFAVTCQQVVQCTAAPAPELTEILDLTPVDGTADGTASAAWGVLSATATATSPAVPPDGHSHSGGARTSAGFDDYLFLVPVDPARVGEPVTLRVHVTGHATTSGTIGGDNWSAQVSFNNWSWSSVPGDEATKTIDEVVDSGRLLGFWMEFSGNVGTAVDAHDGRSTSASASLKVERLIDVVDANGITVPISQICTASGTVYPQ